jgi:hypothetical protein
MPLATKVVKEVQATVTTGDAPMATDAVGSTNAPNSRPVTVRTAPPDTTEFGANDEDKIGAAEKRIAEYIHGLRKRRQEVANHHKTHHQTRRQLQKNRQEHRP